MNKQEFLKFLRKKLRGYSYEDVESAVEYYSELIDDKMANGLTERDAVLSLGDKERIIKDCEDTMSKKDRKRNEDYGNLNGNGNYGHNYNGNNYGGNNYGANNYGGAAPAERTKSGGGSVAAGVAVGIVASPLLLPLGIVAIVAFLVVFIVWMALIISFGAIGIAGIAEAIGNWIFFDNIVYSILSTGIGLVMFTVGLSVCYFLTGGGWKLIKSLFSKIAGLFRRRKRV